MKFTIRKAMLQDYDQLMDLMDEGDTFHREHHPELFRKPPDGIARSLEYISGLLEDPHSQILIAEQENAIVGALVVQVRDAPQLPILVPRRYGMVDNVIVRHTHRGRGIGWALMCEAETWAKSKGAESIELNVFCFNQPAINLYEALGYEAITQRMSKRL